MAGKALNVRQKKVDRARAESADDRDDLAFHIEGLRDHAGYAIRRAQVWIFQDFIKTLAPVDLTPAQYSVLMVTDACPGQTQMAIAKRLGIERSRMVHLLDSLEARKLLRRTVSPTDRRSHALHLTTSGRAAMAQFKALAGAHERKLVEKIGARDHAQLLRILSAFHSE